MVKKCGEIVRIWEINLLFYPLDAIHFHKYYGFFQKIFGRNYKKWFSNFSKIDFKLLYDVVWFQFFEIVLGKNLWKSELFFPIRMNKKLILFEEINYVFYDGLFISIPIIRR